MKKKIMFQEFKFNEIEMHEFLQMPRILITNEYFENLSTDAILLYTLLLDTYKLSTKNNWRDEDGKVYIKFSIGRIQELLRCTHPTAIKVLKELDDVNGIGLIHIKKQKQGMPNLIYVNNYYNQDLLNEQSLKDYEEKDLNNLESSKNSLLVKKFDQSKNFTRVVKNFDQSLVKNFYPNKNEYINNNYSNNEYISAAKADPIPYKEIISYLNKKTNKAYKFNSNKNQSLIKARWNEGNRLEDFKKVIDIKTNQWIHNKEMAKYLRPSTLFGNKFDEYLNESSFEDKGKLDKDKNKANYSMNSYFNIDEMRKKLDELGKTYGN